MPGGDPGGLAARQADLPGHRRQGARRLALLRLGRQRGGRPLRQDGPQRHRIRRHAADRRGVRSAQPPGRPDADALHEVFARWNKGPPRQLPDRDHPRHLRLPRPGDGQAAGGPDPRRRRPEGHRQVDGRLGHRPGHPADADHRGGLRPLPVGPEGRARRRRQGAQGPEAALRRRPGGVHRRRRDGPLRQQDHLLCPGLRPDATPWPRSRAGRSTTAPWP